MIPWKTASDSVNSCVQVARGDVVWARCAGGDCVQVARTSTQFGKVLVRDSKEILEHERGGPPPSIQKWNELEWADFTNKVRMKLPHEAVRFEPDGSVLLGVESCPDRKEILHFTEKEWDAFTRGCIAGKFEYPVLPDIGELIQPSTCTCSKLSSSAEASPGGGPSAGREGLDTGQALKPGVRHGHDPGSPVSRVLPVVQAEKAATGAVVTSREAVPVAAQIQNPECECEYVDIGVGWLKVAQDPDCPKCRPGSLDDALDLLYSPAGHSHAESHREVAASTGSGEVVRLSVPGRPGSSLDDEIDTIVWKRDQTLGEPQGPSRGAARRAGQGPDLADRSSTEAAGTGALPPALVPVADEELRIAKRVRHSLARRLAERYAELEEMRTKLAWMTEERDAYQAEAESLTDQLGDMRAALSAAEAEIDRLRNDANERAIVADEWARAVAPLVPTDGARADG